MFMWLTEEGPGTLRDIVDGRMRELLDRTDFIEDAGVPVYMLEHYLR